MWDALEEVSNEIFWDVVIRMVCAVFGKKKRLQMIQAQPNILLNESRIFQQSATDLHVLQINCFFQSHFPSSI